VLVVSTYELGRQPLALARIGAATLAAGHEVEAADVAIAPLSPASIDRADALVCSVPMHMALRLALELVGQVRARRPNLPIALAGLYAPVARYVRRAAGLACIPTEDGTGIAEWLEAASAPPRARSWARPSPSRPLGSASVRSSGCSSMSGSASRGTRLPLPRPRGGLAPSPWRPARELLPGLEHYARYVAGDLRLLVGATDATRGCAHRCRHCPVPVLYDGRVARVPPEEVLEDVAALVALGARHLSFADPDFLNAPRHAIRVLEAVHGEFPEIGFDLTAKVDHVVRYEALWPRIASLGCRFVLSAIESAEPLVLERLAKGHAPGDVEDAVRVLRRAGIEPRASLVPFTPWSTPQGILELFDLVARLDLVGNVDTVQYAIRLLVPPTSLLLASGALDDIAAAGRLDAFDEEALVVPWRAAMPVLDDLARRLAVLAEQAALQGLEPKAAYELLRAETGRVLGQDRWALAVPPPAPGLASAITPSARPRIDEPWFCCAEPTAAHHERASVAGAKTTSCLDGCGHAAPHAPEAAVLL
jgi:hypothetical protein